MKILDREQTRSGLAIWQIRQLTAYLEEKLCDDISLDDLSRLVGLSSFHFCRAFKQAIGVPPYHWILTKRIERTKSLLTATNRHITDIALACGFSSSQHLSATFNKMTGMTPTQYRAVNKW